jgi:ubiquinone biosynthesis protein Coq4
MAELVKDTVRVAQAIVRVLGDSTKTHEIHRVEEITGRPRYRRLLHDFARTEEGRRIMELRPELSSDHVDYDALRALPEDTLGGAYATSIAITSADYQAAATRHVDDPDWRISCAGFARPTTCGTHCSGSASPATRV